MSEHSAEKDAVAAEVLRRILERQQSVAAITEALRGLSIKHADVFAVLNETATYLAVRGRVTSPDETAALVERSSLGTPGAQALRATVSDEHAARIVAKADQLAGVDALARVMTEADCASSEYPFSDESRAKAVYAAGYRRILPPDETGVA